MWLLKGPNLSYFEEISVSLLEVEIRMKQFDGDDGD